MAEVLDPNVVSQTLAAATLPGELPPEASVGGARETAGSQVIDAEIDDVIDDAIDDAVGKTKAAAKKQAAMPKAETAKAETAKAATAKSKPAKAGAEAAAATEDKNTDDKDAIDALQSLPDKMFARLCRRVPLRTFLPELERLDRAVFYRYFKGYRPGKIDAVHLERVLRKEIFTGHNGLLAQLVIYNWDEAEWRLYGALQKQVKTINEDVEAIESISDEQANPIMDALEAEFDKRDVFIATIINGVRVSKAYVAARFADVK